MKRIISLIISVCLLVTLFVACGAKPSDATDKKSSGPSGGEQKVRVALVGNQKFGDNGPMDDMAAAGERAVKDLGIEFKKIESEPATFEEDIRSMSQEGYDLIITTFGYMSDATELVAKEFPDTKYAAIFQEINTEGNVVPNLWDAVFRGQSTFYVDGYMAGLTTQTNKVGFIVGGEEPGPHSEANAFMRGVRDANPDASVEFGYASYEDSAKAKEVALAMIEKNCDIIQGDCAAPDAGILEAADESSKDVFIMSCIMDFTEVSNNFIGTIKMNYGTAVYDAIEAVTKGEFKGGEQGVRDITNDGYYLAWEIYESFPERTDNAVYREAFKQALVKGKEIEGKILAGELEVEFDPLPPDWSRISAE